MAGSRMIEESVVTSPRCGHQATEQMPTDACQFFYDCKGCGERLKPLSGDCCVFCSYGSSAVSANPTEWKTRMLWLVEHPEASLWSGVRERPHARSISLLFACYRARFNCNRPVTLAASSLRSLYRFVRSADTSRVSSVSFTSSSITSTTRS